MERPSVADGQTHGEHGERGPIKHLKAAVNGNGKVANGMTMDPNGVQIDTFPITLNSNAQANGGIATSERNDPVEEPIAICGMAMRLPGGIHDAAGLWEFLIQKKDARARVPANRYNVDAFYSQSGKAGTVKSQYGYFLDDVNLECIDTSFFSMNKAETSSLDPQQRQLLEVTRECLENAGEVDWRGKSIGCYVGVFGEDWLDIGRKDTQLTGVYRLIGQGDFALGNRISFEYNLTGPSITVRTACSSTMIALDLACRAIKTGECTSAVVGGTNLVLSPQSTISMFEGGLLSPNSRSRTFDAAADGYARGEAINAIFVKRLSDATRDGNPIRAVIRATATNCNGRTAAGMLIPNSESHEAMIRRAYQVAHLNDLSQTALVECHGTGTPVGDPLEVHAVGNVFGEKGVYIGSVKPNLGHSEGASGITSIIKTVLALEKKIILPNINFVNPNPKIPFASKRLQVPVEPTPWPRSCAERASVNSFGVGGANAHVILDSAASFIKERRTKRPQNGQQLLVFSANHPNSLRRLVVNYERYVEPNPDRLSDLAYTLGARREHLIHRAFCVTNGKGPLAVTQSIRAGPAPYVIFVFTGQGAQWAQMGKELIARHQGFQEHLQRMDSIIAELPHPPSWSLQDELLKHRDNSRVDKAEISQPLCTAIQIGLVEILRALGVRPQAVVGHSSGEIAAAYASSALKMREAITIAYYRGQVATRQTQAGGMAAIGLGRAETSKYLVKGVVIACENSPNSVTISGDEQALEQVLVRINAAEPDALTRRLRVDMAYHSHHMKAVGDDFCRLIAGRVSSQAPDVPFFSSVSENIITAPGELDARYWQQNLESPVLFSSAVQRILTGEERSKVFVEIGPHSALAGPIRQILMSAGSKDAYVPTLSRNQDDWKCVLTALGHLHLHSVPVRFAALNPDGQVLTDLPNYPWNHEATYWEESRLSKDWRLRKFPKHDILGSRIVEGSDLEPCWRNVIAMADLPWIRDHMIHNDIVFPLAGYIAMAGEAVRQLEGATKGATKGFSLRHFIVNVALVLQDAKNTELLTSLRPERLTNSLESAWYSFTISSYSGTVWTKHCSGQVRAGAEHATQPTDIRERPRNVSRSHWYDTVRKVGLNFGSAFQGLSEISCETTQDIAVASVSDKSGPDESTYWLHPTTIDCCLQLINVAAARGLSRAFDHLAIPTMAEEIFVGEAASDIKVEAKASYTSYGGIKGDLIAMAKGEACFRISGIKMSPLAGDPARKDTHMHDAAHLTWLPDIDFLDPANMLKTSFQWDNAALTSLERLSFMCTLEILQHVEDIDTNQTHLQKYRSWLRNEVSRAKDGRNVILRDARVLMDMEPSVRQVTIQSIAEGLAGGNLGPASACVTRIVESAKGIFEGRLLPIECLHRDNLLTNLYSSIDKWDYANFIYPLCHSKPNLRILEIGAGTGGTTISMLRELRSPVGDPMYSTYTYTDISAGFFAAAKERFKDAANLEFSVLDITKSPAEQGIEEGSYDVVLATNVLHATPSIRETLRNVRRLLRPDGRLLLQEICPSVRWMNCVMGVLPGWWLGEEDERIQQPYISPERWDEDLRATGFSGTDAVVYDNEAPFHMNASMISTPVPEPNKAAGVTVVCSEPASELARLVGGYLAKQDFRVDFCSLDQKPPAGQDFLALHDLESPFFDDISSERFRAFKSFIAALGSSGLLWVTKPAQIQCKDPRYGLVLGVARAIRAELLIDIATVEMDQVDSDTWGKLLQVFQKFQGRSKMPKGTCDFEYAIHHGTVYVGRYHWSSPLDELTRKIKHDDTKVLQIGKRGLLDTLRWTAHPDEGLQATDEVEIVPRAVGLNSRDLLFAMGTVESAARRPLGLEGAGVIKAVGSNVKDMRVGDRVIFMASGAMSTSFVVPALCCAKLPSGLSFEDAATMPWVYSTVIHALMDVARLQKNQTVLIHSACGGVGMAAIQICQMLGAQIYATVGSEEKVQYLTKTLHIPQNRIFNSRSTSFLPDLMRETGGRGVDVVLNSLSGELLHASWKCVASFGTMVEIGKRDLVGFAKLSMELFEANRKFCGVDLMQLSMERGDMCQR